MDEDQSLSTSLPRRLRKRLATRQAISDAATRLFAERGFDHVTVDEIAEAADVGRMTVFNHFRRKEDMFFDLDQGWREDVLKALEDREAGVGPVEAFRRFAHHAVEQHKPYVSFSPASQRFHDAMAASEPLKARWRAIRDEAADMLAGVLAKVKDDKSPDADAQLVAHLMAATWTVSLMQGHAAFRTSEDARAAEALFLSLMDKVAAGLTRAMADTFGQLAGCDGA
jgi:AcrR family transcriptional regulator